MPDDGRGRAFDLVAAEILRQGPIPFDRFVDLALYDRAVGFYESVGVAGRRGDFVTGPETGPLFGLVIGSALDSWWDELGRPDPFVVVDAGAGPGTLARSVLRGGPRCSPALRYVLVERSNVQRRRHAEHLELSSPELSRSGRGPTVVSLAAWPELAIHVVLANELLDNLPFRVVERDVATEGGWSEVRVALAPDGSGLVEQHVPAAEHDGRLLAELAPHAPPGARVPLQTTALAWLRQALDRVPAGRVVVIDYGDSTASLAVRDGGWLRTYRSHERGGSPLSIPGDQDVTSDLAIDQLSRGRAPTSDRAHAEFVRAHGVERLVEEGRSIWSDRAHLGDLAAVEARSRVSEAEALLDPEGIGAFRVLEWVRG